MEVNPEHPATKEMHDLWHKVSAILMARLNTEHVVIKVAEVEELNKRMENKLIVFHGNHDELHIRILPEALALQLLEDDKKLKGKKN